MKFVVDYRGPDGSRQQREIEAADRAGVFAELKKLGINAISVREGTMSKKPRKAAKVSSKSVPPSVLRGVLAGIVVVALAVVLYLVLGNHGAKTQDEKRTSKRYIEEVNPVQMESGASTVATQSIVVEPKKKHPLRTYVDERGVLRYEGGLRVVTKEPKRVLNIGSGKPRIFNYGCETEIAGLLQIEPGDLLVGDIVYGERFVEDFKKSLLEPIIISSDDDEETKELKRAVIDTKIEMKERMDAGEDIAKLMTDTRAELQKLGTYRETLREELMNIRKEGTYTAQEIEDFAMAANELLTKKGLPPLAMPKKILAQMLKREIQ